MIKSSISSRIDSENTPTIPHRAFTTGMGKLKKCWNRMPAMVAVNMAMMQERVNRFQLIRRRSLLMYAPKAPAMRKRRYLFICYRFQGSGFRGQGVVA